MSYIGSNPQTQNFTSGTDYFSGTGSQVAFTLSRSVPSINDIEVFVNNVSQQPNTVYTVSGFTLTFTTAPSIGTQNVYVRYLSTTTQVITPGVGTVGIAQHSATGTPGPTTFLRGDNTWGQIGVGATGGGGNQVFVLNDQIVTVSYTIPTGKNASSAGPITIDTGVTVTVPTDSTWVIV